MNAWNFDADSIRLQDDLANFTLIQNTTVAEYVNNYTSDSKFFVVATKGVGKTLLLKYKSIQYRNKTVGFHFVPPNELCEKLTAIQSDIAFGQDELAIFTERDNWQDIWSVCLISVVLKRLKLPVPRPLDEVIGNGTLVDDVLNAFLRSRRSLYQFTRLLNTDLFPALEGIRSQVAVFLDNVDEAMDRHVGTTLERARIRKGLSLGAVSEKIWINAQLGLIDAIKAIHFRNSHVKIFASIRLEAFNADTRPNHTQTRLYCTALGYSDDDLKRIFESNIDLMESGDLAAADATTPIERLLGFDRVKHPFVRDAVGNIQTEDAFEYVLRHTLRRPRELLLIGGAISKTPPASRTEDRFKDIVNNVGTQIFEQYRTEILPYWDYAESAEIFEMIKQNVFSRAEVLRLTAQIIKKRGKGKEAEMEVDPFVSLYRKGLLGHLREQRGSNQQLQTFLPAAEHIYNQQETLPNSSHYFLHPCLTADLRRNHGANIRLDQNNIIGYEYPFVGPFTQQRQSKLHVHFGAGKIGLGLTVPTLSRRANICIIQRPSERWRPLLNVDEGKLVDVSLSIGKEVVKLILLRDSSDDEVNRNAIQQWRSGSHLLVLSENNSLLRAILQEATSFSTALKNGLDFATRTLGLVAPRNKKNIYCFENERGDIDSFRADVSRLSSKYAVHQVVADRICSEVSFRLDPPRIDVNCQQEGHVYLLGDVAKTKTLFGGSLAVTFATDEEDLRYFYERKFYLMNVVHAAMAFNAYASLAHKNIPPLRWKDQFLATDPHDNLIRSVIAIQICRVILQNRDALNRRYPGVKERELFIEISRFADNAADRIFDSADLIQRVLSPDAASLSKKFRSRVKDMSDFVERDWEEVEKWNIPDVPTHDEIAKTLRKLNADVIEVVMKALETC
jgi:hypothetical protein